MQLCTGEETITVYIHNVYNLGLEFYFSTICLSMFLVARQQISNKVREYIMRGDFNLYHSFWNGLTQPTQYATADVLLDLIDNFDFFLTFLAVKSLATQLTLFS